MNPKYAARKVAFRTLAFIASLSDSTQFICPLCDYRGIFLPAKAVTGVRKYAICPACGSAERHRMQWLVLKSIQRDFSSMRCLHFAPEPFFRSRFSRMFAQYKTADLSGHNVDFKADITNLPFADKSYDFVYASHVLEHVKDDRKAISEVRRVLSDSGIAVLPVPIFDGETVEYPVANPTEHGHVRFPGIDFYDRYKAAFQRVDLYHSTDFPENFQTFVYEDRANWPTPDMPLRKPSYGKKHIDVIPVAYCS
jgi:SAM-dependent methyltransferase